MFSRIFGYKKNWELLKDFLEAILPDIEIKKIKIVKQYNLDKETVKNRGAVLDVLAELNDDTIVNVEMQMTDYKNTVERSVFYDSGVYHEGLIKNADFKDAKRTIGIWILNYNIFEENRRFSTLTLHSPLSILNYFTCPQRTESSIQLSTVHCELLLVIRKIVHEIVNRLLLA